MRECSHERCRWSNEKAQRVLAQKVQTEGPQKMADAQWCNGKRSGAQRGTVALE